MNFRELRNRLISSLWDYIGCPVILSNQVQPEAEPPFCIYRTCKRMIEKGNTAGMATKLDVFYAANKLTEDEYNELTALLAEKTEKKEQV